MNSESIDSEMSCSLHFLREIGSKIDIDRHTKFSELVSLYDNRSKTRHEAETDIMLTPLEKQVLSLKESYPKCLLMVECGYRIRFFGEDACIASKVLGIYCNRNTRHWEEASIPTHRIRIHLKKLVSRGLKVALVRQMETAMSRLVKMEAKAVTSNATFERKVVAVYTPGIHIDDDDQAFEDMLLQQPTGFLGRARCTSTGVSESSGCIDEEGAVGWCHAEQDADEEDAYDTLPPDFDDISSVVDKDSGSVAVENNAQQQSSESVLAIVYAVDVKLCVVALNMTAHSVECYHVTAPVDCSTASVYELGGILDLIRPSEVLVTVEADGKIRCTLAERTQDGLVTNDHVSAYNEYISRVSEISASWLFEDVVSVVNDLRLPKSLPFFFQFGVAALSRYVDSLSTSTTRSLRGLAIVDVDTAAESTSTNCFQLDYVTAKDLEVFAVPKRSRGFVGASALSEFLRGYTGRESGGGNSLFRTIDSCCTQSGRRKLRSWLLRPLTSVEAIRRRQEIVLWLRPIINGSLSTFNGYLDTWAAAFHILARDAHDLEKILVSLHLGRASPKRVAQLLRLAVGSLARFAEACVRVLDLAGRTTPVPHLLLAILQSVDMKVICMRAQTQLSQLNEDALNAGDAVNILHVSAVSKNVASVELKHLLQLRARLSRLGDQVLEHLLTVREKLQKPDLQWKTLRSGSGQVVLQFLVELPRTHAVPDKDWVLVNSTKSVNRFHTPFILTAQAEMARISDEIRTAARSAWAVFVRDTDAVLHDEFRKVAHLIGEVDAFFSLARLSQHHGYTLPLFDSATDSEVVFKGARHPVVEKVLAQKGDGKVYIANDVHLRCFFGERSCQVITGPNMGGKSSYVRMIAVISLLGQMGSFVPAQNARLCIFDGIYTRMGAEDDISQGRSTFMVELTRTSDILRRASARSLVILDELGRGTSTLDGMAIAMATLLYFVEKIGCAMLFITHYTQISSLVQRLSSSQIHAQPGDQLPSSALPSLPPSRKRTKFSPTDEACDVNFNALRGKAVNVHMSYISSLSTPAACEEEDGGSVGVALLYAIAEGPAAGSYGINVAKSAGLSAETIAEATKASDWMLKRNTEASEAAYR